MIQVIKQQQQRVDNYNNNPQSRRPNNGIRGRRGGIGGNNSYRGGTQSDAGTGGK